MRTSKTDWDRVKREAEAEAPIPYSSEDELYDPNDPEAVDAFWKKATIRRRGERGPQKKSVKVSTTIRLSPEVLEGFRAMGPGWQTRMDAVLADWLKTHSPE
ncbi:BrnA antitoxin family protein [Azotobacter chroococcum]|uniref:Uncharacterized protein (DUF4415 family) n=1 Tax=Azotobacter chroococcum TaxID=353 RepID=A0A4R1PKJ8_9GAMM|nr:BrnA antitoxin family protein [Azotobacter chroococcum]TBV97746.1 hypothetical protein E0E53_08265 [Azotobacter chroococcum]TCL28172.1 uncharacterized protein (DUF4415 family) [Azotobacter chroococcum]